MDGEAAPPEFAEEFSLGQPRDCRRLAEGGFLGDKEADGQVQRR
jgi:hypothetical protein